MARVVIITPLDEIERKAWRTSSPVMLAIAGVTEKEAKAATRFAGWHYRTKRARVFCNTAGYGFKVAERLNAVALFNDTALKIEKAARRDGLLGALEPIEKLPRDTIIDYLRLAAKNLL